MIANQETRTLSPYMEIYNLVVPKDNMLRKINELVDFSFILDELKTNIALTMVVMPSRPSECLSIYY